MTLVIAHRGASKAEKENTIAAFERALELGADWVELDVRRAACGTAVVHHDSNVADGRLICETPADDLPDYVSSLEAVIEACGPMGVNIEIKSDLEEPDYDDDHRIVATAVRTARRMLPLDRILVTSFDMSAINRSHDVDANVPTGFLTSDDLGPEVSIGRAVAHNHSAVNPWVDIVTQRWVDAAHEAELKVYTWTCDDPKRMKELISFGVDGIITNTPDVLRKIVG